MSKRHYQNSTAAGSEASDTVCVPEGRQSVGPKDFARSSRHQPLPRRILLPESLRTIADGTFARQQSLDDILIPSGVTTLGTGAFRGCCQLRRLVLPAGVTEIAPELFVGCSALEEVVFLGPVTAIGEDAFADCYALRRVQFAGAASADGELITPETLTEIGAGAFQHCGALHHIVLNAGLQTVGERAFAGCRGLEEISGTGSTAYGANMAEYCPPFMPLRLPGEVPSDQRPYYGLADLDGFLYQGAKLTGYVGQDSVVRVPEGIETIAPHALDRLRWRSGIEVIWPASLRRVEENKVLLGGAASEPYPALWSRGHRVTRFELELLQNAWRGSVTAENLAMLYLEGSQTASGWAEAEAPRPAAFSSVLLGVLAKRNSKTARRRAAVYFVRHADEIRPQQKDELQTLLTGGAPGDGDRQPYREAILDVILEAHGIDPADPAFSFCRARESGAEASPLTVKSAFVPYLVQAAGLSRRMDALTEAPGYIPAAEEQARRLVPETLAAVLGFLREEHHEDPELMYAHARFAMQDQMAPLIDWTLADMWETSASQITQQMAVVRAGALLSATGAAQRLMLSAPKRLGLRRRYRALHPEAHILKPDDSLGLGRGSVLFEEEGVSLSLEIADGLALQIRDNGSGRSWKHMPKNLGLGPQALRKFEHLVEQGKLWTEAVRRQLQEALLLAYVSGDTLDAGWLAWVLNDPVLRRGLSCLVFEQGDRTFVFCDGAAQDAAGNAVHTADLSGVRAAHVRDLDPAVMDAWREAFAANGWRSTFDQMREPRYEADEIDPCRFASRRVALTGIADPVLRDFLSDSLRQLGSAGMDGSTLHCFRSRYASEVRLERIHIGTMTRRLNRVVYHLDQLTALERLRQGDPSVLKFYSLAANARLNSALREAAHIDAPELMAGLLAIRDSRRRSADRSPRLSESFSL